MRRPLGKTSVGIFRERRVQTRSFLTSRDLRPRENDLIYLQNF